MSINKLQGINRAYSVRTNVLERLWKPYGPTLYIRVNRANRALNGHFLDLTFVHPSEDAVQNAMSRLGGHKIGHSLKSEEISGEVEKPQVVKGRREDWCARRDSNLRRLRGV
jgi:hypothetical protein